MLKKYLHIILACFLFGSLQAQNNYGNEWINDFSKKYYSFKVGKDGLYKISYNALKSIGLEGTNADNFQLWRNGEEVALYTSSSNAPLPSDGYIEFIGKINDGSFDKRMYSNVKNQTSDHWSLLTDTAVYFLTLHTASKNLRYQSKANNSTTSNLIPEEYFNYTYQYAFKENINPGNPNVIAGVNVYSSSFDEGEGWTSKGVTSAKPFTLQIPNLQAANAGPDPSFRVNFIGGAFNTRPVSVSINGTSILSAFNLSGYSSVDTTITFSKTKLSSTNQLDFINASPSIFDQYVVGQVLISYARKFHFGDSSKFEFNLGPSATEKLIEISGFNHAAVSPILYDRTNQFRYQGELKGTAVRFLLPADAKGRSFVLLSAANDQVNSINALPQHQFLDFSNASNQGNYIIITDSILRKSAKGDAIDNYKKYRSSIEGGGFKVAVVDVSELVDQFAFGIKKHPMAVKNFIQYAISRFKPQNILLIGKGVTYDQYRLNESSPYANQLNLVPSFGSPASDHILASKDLSPLVEVPIGRLSVVNGDELNAYLDKLKQHDDLYNTTTAYQTLDRKGWTKNVLHLVAGGAVQPIVSSYMREAAKKITDTLFGAKLTTIEKSTSAVVETGNVSQIDQLFADGLGLVNYFGHSSLNAMEFNLDDPGRFGNQGKYPLFIANACTAGNNFFYDSLRISSDKKSISEKYILEAQKGSIGFIASTHYGVLMNLNEYIQRFYNRIGKVDYYKTIGEIQKNTMLELQNDFGNLQNNVTTMEQILLHGDPAIKLYPHPKADYAIEESMVSVSPQPLSIAESYYDIKMNVRNLGNAHNDSVKVVFKRDRGDGSSELITRMMKSLNYGDSISYKFLLDPKKDLGVQTISVTVDPDNQLDEISEINNSVIKKITIVDNDVKPVYPYEFALVNKWPVKLSASIGSFSTVGNQYIFQADTTANFNSPLLDSAIVSSNGGLIEYQPSFTIADSTVIYWRVSKRPTQGASYNWFNSSFTYISNAGEGWSQSSYFQFLKNTYTNIDFNEGRSLNFSKKNLVLYVQSRLRSNPSANNTVEVGNTVVYNQSCDAAFGSLEFSLITKRTGLAIKNTTPPGSPRYGSFVPSNCFSNLDLYQFWFSYNTQQGRNNAANFFDYVPNGTILVMNHWNKSEDTQLKTVDQWNKDALYNKLIGIGFSLVDSFKSNVPFTLIAYKNETGSWSVLKQRMGKTSDDTLFSQVPVEALQTSGQIDFPVIGPSKNWKSISLKSAAAESSIGDNLSYKIIGITKDLNEEQLYVGSVPKNGFSLTKDTSLAFIDANKYPWIRIMQTNSDGVNQTVSQLKYVQVKYESLPEGGLMGVNPTTLIPVLDIGSNYQFQVSYKNVSNAVFDSIKVIWKITNDKNKDSILFDGFKKKLIAGDTIQFTRNLNTRLLSSDNLISLSVNPQNAQPEQYMFNNYLQTRLKVNADKIPPSLDVTFDGVHILNRDIVSSRPVILIELKDNNNFLPLNDTSLFKIRLRYPDGSIKSIKFDNDTLKFSPSTNTPGSGENAASIFYKPVLRIDGEYELLVSAKDRSDNPSGSSDFSVMFQVINKSMITNLLNYPNPFTTSTAFVFTLTGAELPTNMRIQILTITGKIVKEITLAELGPLKIGNNITQYKWDGRDQYGQQLANGVYLYRVLTDMKGKKIDKLNTGSYNTDQFFNRGYGKMYLMR